MSQILIAIFWRVLAASAIGGGLALLLLALRPWLGRLGSRFAYYCWLAPLLVLLLAPLLPIAVLAEGAGSGDSVWLEAPVASGASLGSSALPVSWSNAGAGQHNGNELMEPEQSITGEEPETAAKADRAGVKELLGRAAVYLTGLWLAGVGLGLVGWAAAYGLLRRRIARHSRRLAAAEVVSGAEALTARLERLQLREDDGCLGAPFLAGLLRPCLVLPGAGAALSELDWRNLLEHELVHFERRDLWYKWLGLLACVVHWFNPAVWQLRRALGECCEISCDLAVCGPLDAEGRRSYMRTILQLLRPGRHILTTGMSDSKGLLRRRFEMIDKGDVRSRGRRLAAIAVGAVLLLLALAGGVSAANIGGKAADGLTAPKLAEQVTVSRGGVALTLENKPFIEQGVVYLPLREVLEQFEVLGKDDPGLGWRDGKLHMDLLQWLEDAAGGQVLSSFYSRDMALEDIGGRLRNDVVYVPAEFVLELGLYAQAAGGEALGGFSVSFFEADGQLVYMCSLPELLRDEDASAGAKEFLNGWLNADDLLLFERTIEQVCTQELQEEWQKEFTLSHIAAAAVNRLRNDDDNEMLELLVLAYPRTGLSNYDLETWLIVVDRESGLVKSVSSGLKAVAVGDEALIGGADGPTAIWLTTVRPEGDAISLTMPLPNGRLTQGFSERHTGLDLAAETGEPVFAAAAGQVLAAGYMGADGNKVLLEHGNGLETRYAHLSQILVEPGQRVSAGEVIGYVGSTGNSTGPHLHFVVLLNGTAVDPAQYWPAKPDTVLGIEDDSAFSNLTKEYFAGSKTDMGELAAAYYQEENIAFFKVAFGQLAESEQEDWLERLYGDGNIAFFAASVSELAWDSPLIESMAARAYADRELGFFSVAADRLSRERLEAWADRAAAEKDMAARSILMGLLDENGELAREQEELAAQQAAQQEKDYAAVGILTGSVTLNEYYYQGRLVRILLDPRRGGDFYVLNINPEGVVNIKVERDAEDKISGVRYLTDSEVKELFGD